MLCDAVVLLEAVLDEEDAEDAEDAEDTEDAGASVVSAFTVDVVGCL